MITSSQVLEEGDLIPGGGAPYIKGSFVMEFSGYLYPFDRDSNMLNPLDPVNLLLSWPIVGGDDDTGKFEKVLRTMIGVTAIRKAGFTPITQYKSGAVRTIKLTDGTDKVVILGEYARSRGLILPILSTQLSADYKQDSIDLWNSLGFKTPSHYGICSNTNTYSVDGWRGTALLDGSKTVTYYNIIGGGREITVKKVYSDVYVQSISDDDDRDWDYGADERTRYDISVKPIDAKFKTAAPYHKTTPNYVWQDKGDENE